MHSTGTLTVDDLVTAFVEYDKYRGCNEEICRYYQKRLEILKSLFECNIEKRAEEFDREFRGRLNENRDRPGEAEYEIQGRLTVIFFEICIGAANKLRNPFHEFSAGLLAGMPPKVVRDLHQKYSNGIDECIKILENLNRTLVKEVLAYMFPGIEKRRVKESLLFEKGLPREIPDVNDLSDF